MKENITTRLPFSRRTALAITLSIIVLILLVLFLHKSPDRSVSAYCDAYKTQKAIIAAADGKTYNSAVFQESSSDTRVFAQAYTKLAHAAPDEIQKDTETLSAIYQAISNDPSQALSASMSGIGAEDAVVAYTKDHCQ